MDLEQDAMLTAIGQMSMEEARERWASRWSEFVQSMSRWKSLHVLLMMARINAQQQILAQSIKDLRARESVLESLREEKWEIMDSIDQEADEIETLASLKEQAEEESKVPKGPIMWRDFTGKFFGSTPRTYKSAIEAAKAAASLAAEYEAAGGDKRLYELGKENRKHLYESLEISKKIETTESDIQAAKIKQKELQDEYDIAKPYAMGLLVADIFKSLAMAIQGEIY